MFQCGPVWQWISIIINSQVVYQDVWSVPYQFLGSDPKPTKVNGNLWVRPKKLVATVQKLLFYLPWLALLLVSAWSPTLNSDLCHGDGPSVSGMRWVGEMGCGSMCCPCSVDWQRTPLSGIINPAPLNFIPIILAGWVLPVWIVVQDKLWIKKGTFT